MSVKAIEQMIKASQKLVNGDKEGFISDVSVIRELNSGRAGRVLSALENSIGQEESLKEESVKEEPKSDQEEDKLDKLFRERFSVAKDQTNYIDWSERRDET